MSATTPWGNAHTTKEYAEGITFYTTSGHGGFHLSDAREAELRKLLPEWHSFGGYDTWYEEDCDWAVVVLVFPQYFDAETMFNAARVARRWSEEAGSKWQRVLPLADRAEVRSILDAESKRRESLWEVGSMFCGGFRDDFKDKWVVHMSRGTEKVEVLIDYPTKRLYSDEELAGMLRYTQEMHESRNKKYCHNSTGL